MKTTAYMAVFVWTSYMELTQDEVDRTLKQISEEREVKHKTSCQTSSRRWLNQKREGFMQAGKLAARRFFKAKPFSNAKEAKAEIVNQIKHLSESVI